MEVPIPLQLEIDKELTYTIASHNPNDPPQVIKNMSIIRSGLISIPIGRMDLIPNDYEVVDKRLIIERPLVQSHYEITPYGEEGI